MVVKNHLQSSSDVHKSRIRHTNEFEKKNLKLKQAFSQGLYTFYFFQQIVFQLTRLHPPPPIGAGAGKHGSAQN